MRSSLSRSGAVIAVIFALVGAVFGASLRFPFVWYDDPSYILTNPLVKEGLSWEGVLRAWTFVRQDNWHPLTWLSHMLDVELFGMNAGAHRAVNVALHALISAGVFLVLSSLTGRRWASAAAAALFAVHPLRVESVVWVSERKDLLAAFFFMAGIGAYQWYVRRPGGLRYAALLACFLLGCLAKPMVVTFPAVLLLLDFWPLGRWGGAAAARGRRPDGPPIPMVLAEKLPLFLVSAALVALTLRTQSHAGLRTLASFPLEWRLENAAWSYLWYLGKLLWPTRLAVFYPHPGGGLGWAAAAAGAVLVAVAVFAARQRRSRPWIAVGVLWFFGMLFPVIGLFQAGDQARADRYVYLPSIGVLLALAMGAAEFARRGVRRRAVAISVTVAATLLLAGAAWRQVGVWRDSITLFERALAVTEDNYVAHGMLGYSLAQEGRMPEAVEQFYRCLLLDPGNIVTRRWVEGNRALLPPGAVIPPLPLPGAARGRAGGRGGAGTGP